MTSLSALNGCLNDQAPFSLIYNQQTHEIHYIKLKKRQQTNWHDNALALSLFLQHLPLLQSPKEAVENKLLSVSRSVIKKLSEKLENDPVIKKCNNLLLAHRLAIPEEVLDRNPGFAAFAKQCFLYNYLAAYDERLSYDSNTHELLIKYKKQQVKWSHVPERIKRFHPIDRGNVYEPWKYGPNGLRDKNFYDFVDLKKVFRRDPREWGNRFVLGICTSCVDKPRTDAGDHSWVRLYDGETGYIYSVGLYRPDKRYEDKPRKDCLRVKAGFLMIDSSEFWGQPIQEIRVGITKNQFMEMKTLIERDKTKEIKRTPSQEKLEDALKFQLMHANCTAYAGKVAGVARINLPDRIPFYMAFFYSKFYSATMMKRITVLSSWIPGWVQRINTFVLTFLGNIIALAYGAWKVDPALAAVSNTKPSFNSLSQLLDRNLILNRSPFVLGQITRLKIEKWRADETEKLRYQLSTASPEQREGLLRQIDDLQYTLPPEGYLDSP